MKIALVGCGALGSYYGACLCRTGAEVRFLLRSDYEAVRRDGVRILSPAGDFTAHPHCARTPQEIGPCDLVVIGLKTTANGEFPALLPPLVAPRTAVLTLQNGLGSEEQLAALFGADRVLGGLCFVCLNRTAPGVIQHSAHGRIVLGEFTGAARPRTHEIAALFHQAGIPCDVTDHLHRAHWEKLVWNVPFNGLGVAACAGWDAVAHDAEFTGRKSPCLSTDLLLADPRWRGLARELMHEVIATANALGLALPVSAAEEQIRRTYEMGAYRASTLVDFERGQPLELDSLFLEPLRRARAAAVTTPRLAALCRVLRQLSSCT
jgi:2-dehydropantoate 2-reductase